MVSQKDKDRADTIIGKMEGVVTRHPKTMLVLLAIAVVANFIRF